MRVVLDNNAWHGEWLLVFDSEHEAELMMPIYTVYSGATYYRLVCAGGYYNAGYMRFY